MQENSKRNKLEKELKTWTRDNPGLRVATQYVKVLKDIAFSKLIQEQQTEQEIILLTGELRVLQKLLDVLELREVPTFSVDNATVNSSSRIA